MTDHVTIAMLGYLPPVTWASAVKSFPDDKERIYELMRDQEEAYNFELVPDVEWLLEDKKSYREELRRIGS